MIPVYMVSGIRFHLGRTACLFFTLLLSFPFLPAVAQGPNIRYTLKSDVFRMATAAGAECQRSFEELKEKL
jgi:hypothetical protein